MCNAFNVFGNVGIRGWNLKKDWIPVFAGMTARRESRELGSNDGNDGGPNDRYLLA